MVGEHWSQKTVIMTASPRCIFIGFHTQPPWLSYIPACWSTHLEVCTNLIHSFILEPIDRPHKQTYLVQIQSVKLHCWNSYQFLIERFDTMPYRTDKCVTCDFGKKKGWGGGIRKKMLKLPHKWKCKVGGQFANN